MASTIADSLFMPMAHFRLMLRRFAVTPELRASLLDGTGVSEGQVDDAGFAMPLASHLKLLGNLDAVIGEGWQLDVPAIWSEAAQGELGLAWRSAPDFATTLRIAAEFGHARAPIYRASSRRTARGLTIVFPATVPIDAPAWRAVMTNIALNVVTVARAITGAAADTILYAFEGPPPIFAERLAGMLGAKASWGNARFTIHFPAPLLAVKSPYADPATFAGAVDKLRTMAARHERHGSLAPRVSQILHAVVDGRLDAAETARRVGMSDRTLERRLAAEGTSFRNLVEASLKARLDALLAGPRISREAIAERLGYDDPSSLSRACRRWYGQSLSQQRQRATLVSV